MRPWWLRGAARTVADRLGELHGIFSTAGTDSGYKETAGSIQGETGGRMPAGGCWETRGPYRSNFPTVRYRGMGQRTKASMASYSANPSWL